MTGVSAAATEMQGAATGAIADVSVGTEETGGAAERVMGAATEMSAKSGQLSEAIHRFLDGIRAA
jgi:methyl-accepting chemotaxis protein